MKTLKIARWVKMEASVFVAYIMALGLVFWAVFAFAQESAPFSYEIEGRLSLKLQSDEWGSFGFGSPFEGGALKTFRGSPYNIMLRGPKYGAGPVPADRTPGPVITSLTPSPEAIFDPWKNLQETLRLTSREVAYTYGADGVTPFEIIEVSPSGREITICKIRSGISEDGLMTTTLVYGERANGRDVVVTFDGAPDWANLLASASYADGVYYRMMPGGTVTKAVNEYDRNGKKTASLMKIWHFDAEGRVSSEETLKERVYYNANGDLISWSTSREEDGRLVAVTWVNCVYSMEGKILLRSRNELSYNKEGIITSSTAEQMMFDKKGREIRYTLTDYERGRKTHAAKRLTAYNGNYPWLIPGDTELTYFLSNEEWFDENGDVNRAESIEKRVLVTQIDNGRFIKEERTVNTHRIGEFVSRDIYIERHDEQGRLVYNGYWNKADGGYAYERIETYLFDDATGGFVHTAWSANYDRDGLRSSHRSEDEECFDDKGRLVKRRNYHVEEERSADGSVRVQSVSDYAYEYEYDADGDILVARERGYWSSNWMPQRNIDNLTTFLYEVIGGIKKLVNTHVRNITATDKEFAHIVSRFEEDIASSYTIVNGEVRLAEVIETYESETYDENGNSIRSEKTVTREAYTYDERGNIISRVTSRSSTAERYETSTHESYEYDERGNLTAQSKIGYTNGEMTYVELVFRAYYENGQLASASTHYESMWGGVSDETILYNEEGNLLLHSLATSGGEYYQEEREYGADGRTLLSRDVISNRSKYPLPNPVEKPGADRLGGSLITLGSVGGHYELHERYRADGKITYRAERRVQGGNHVGWPASSASTEYWEYDAQNGNLAHYTGTFYSHSGGTGLGTTKVIEEDYDAGTGKLLREEYTVRGGEVGVIAGEVGKGRLDTLRQEKDVNALVAGITQYLLSQGFSQLTTKKLIIQYGAGKVEVQYTVSDLSWNGKDAPQGETLASCSGTIEYDADGKVLDFSFSYAGEGEKKWQDMLEGLQSAYLPYEEETMRVETPKNKGPYVDELIAKLALEETKSQQWQDRPHEMVREDAQYKVQTQ